MPKMTYWPLRYGVAVVAVAVAIAFLLIPQIGRGLGSIVFLAVLISAWYGGMGPGLLLPPWSPSWPYSSWRTWSQASHRGEWRRSFCS